MDVGKVSVAAGRGSPEGVDAARAFAQSSWPDSTLLGRLPRVAVEALLAEGSTRFYQPGEHLLRQGETTNHVLVLTDGLVKVTAATPDGRVLLLAIRVPGDLVGEFAPIDGSPRSASVIADMPTRVQVIPGPAFLAFMRQHPNVSLEIARSITGKMRYATGARLVAGGYPVVMRLARMLRDLAASYGEKRDGDLELRISLSQAELAALVGSSEPAIHKALRELRERGLVATRYRRIVITDVEQLSKIAGPPG